MVVEGNKNFVTKVILVVVDFVVEEQDFNKNQDVLGVLNSNYKNY